LFMSFAFGGVFACFFSHFHQLMITDSGIIEFVRPTTRFGDLNFDWQKDNENCNR